MKHAYCTTHSRPREREQDRANPFLSLASLPSVLPHFTSCHCPRAQPIVVISFTYVDIWNGPPPPPTLPLPCHHSCSDVFIPLLGRGGRWLRIFSLSPSFPLPISYSNLAENGNGPFPPSLPPNRPTDRPRLLPSWLPPLFPISLPSTVTTLP